MANRPTIHDVAREAGVSSATVDRVQVLASLSLDNNRLEQVGPATFAGLDDAFIEWYFLCFGKRISRDMVLPILRELQGHPEAGRLWEAQVTAMIVSLGWRSTTHEKNFYQLVYYGIKKNTMFSIGYLYQSSSPSPGVMTRSMPKLPLGVMEAYGSSLMP